MAPPTPTAAAKPISTDKATEASKKCNSKNKKEKPANEIEEIFRAAKGKNKKRKEASTSENKNKKKEEMKTKTKTKKMKGEKLEKEKKSGLGEDYSRKRRKTADGLTVYSADELGFANPDAGGTALCPFDCDCCF